jgi:hypothetical protein
MYFLTPYTDFTMEFFTFKTSQSFLVNKTNRCTEVSRHRCKGISIYSRNKTTAFPASCFAGLINVYRGYVQILTPNINQRAQ